MTTTFIRDVQHMSAAERKAEISAILARGFLALVAQRNRVDRVRESDLNALAVSGHSGHLARTPSTREEA